MSIKYKAYKSNFEDKEGNKSNYILAKTVDTLSMDELTRLITDACSVNNSDILAVLEAFKSFLNIYLGRGRNVQLYDLGVLKPKISAEFDKKGKVVSGSEKVKTIQFIPTAKFLSEIRDRSKFEQIKSKEPRNDNYEIRSERFLSELSDNTLFTRKEYASFIKRDYNVAVNDIEKLIENNKIDVKRFGRDLFYFKNK